MMTIYPGPMDRPVELSSRDAEAFLRYVPDGRRPDLTIGTDAPYLYRWYVVPKNPDGNVYFHLQVASDPDRPLHDHPWDNQSVILAGGFAEVVCSSRSGHKPPFEYHTRIESRVPGGVYHRKADEAHRLILPEGQPYSMSQFTTGPKIREWGFYTPDGWRHWEECVDQIDQGDHQISKWKGDRYV